MKGYKYMPSSRAATEVEKVERFRIRSESEGGEDEGVGTVDGGGVEAGEVDLGRGFAVVSHAFRDD